MMSWLKVCCDLLLPSYLPCLGNLEPRCLMTSLLRPMMSLVCRHHFCSSTCCCVATFSWVALYASGCPKLCSSFHFFRSLVVQQTRTTMTRGLAMQLKPFGTDSMRLLSRRCPACLGDRFESGLDPESFRDRLRSSASFHCSREMVLMKVHRVARCERCWSSFVYWTKLMRSS